MDWVENTETLEALTYEQAVNDIASAIDNPRDCIYSVGELVDIASRHFNVNGSKLLGAATFYKIGT
jgi:hypothetical protein